MVFLSIEMRKKIGIIIFLFKAKKVYMMFYDHGDSEYQVIDDFFWAYRH